MVAALVIGPALAGLLVTRRRWSPALGWWATGVAAATAAVALWAAVVEATATWSWGPRLELVLAAEGLARVLIVLVPTVGAAVLAWVAATGGHEARPARLAGVLVVFLGAMELLVLAADLLTLLVGWELVAACSWALITHRHDDAERAASATAAYLTTRVGDVGLFLAAGASLAGAGSLRYADLGAASDGWLALAAAGVLVAAAAKSAQLPFSPWLFSAMAGPTPVSALLHSATMVAAGAYILARLAPAFAGVAWFGDTVAWLGLATALAAGIVAAVQPDLKRALAASTSAQYGLVLIAIGAGAVGAAGAQLVTHAVFKALLFLTAGTVLHLTGTTRLSGVGVGRRALPIVVVFGVGAAALAAVPPLGGAWSKEEVLAAAAHRSAVMAAGVVAAGGLSAFYAIRLALAVAAPGTSEAGAARRPTWAELTPLAVLAAASVDLGVLWLPGGGALVERLTGGGLATGASWELPVSLVVLVAAGAGAAAQSRRHAEVPGALAGWAAGWFGFPTLARVVVVDPVVRLSHLLARVDDRVVDAGVRAAAAIAEGAARLASGVAEVNVDRVVRGVAGGWAAAAVGLRRADERGVDAAVEGVAAAAVVAARRGRRLQSGLSHEYYVIVSVGVVVVVVVALVGRT